MATVSNLTKKYTVDVDLVLSSKKRNFDIMVNKINEFEKENKQRKTITIKDASGKRELQVSKKAVANFFNHISFKINNDIVLDKRYGKHMDTNFRHILSKALVNSGMMSMDLDELIFYYDDVAFDIFAKMYTDDKVVIDNISNFKKFIKETYDFTNVELDKEIIKYIPEDELKKINIKRVISHDQIYRAYLRSFVYFMSNLNNRYTIKITDENMDVVNYLREKSYELKDNVSEIIKRDSEYKDSENVNNAKELFKNTIHSQFSDKLKSQSQSSFFKHFIGFEVSEISNIVMFYYKEFEDSFKNSKKSGAAVFENSMIFSKKILESPETLYAFLVLSHYISTCEEHDAENKCKIKKMNIINDENCPFEMKSILVLADILSTVFYDLHHIDSFPKDIDPEIAFMVNNLYDITSNTRQIFNNINEYAKKVEDALQKDKKENDEKLNTEEQEEQNGN